MSRFIVIEGLDGSGKTTQINLLKQDFANHPVVFTREPGGTERAEDIRKVLFGTYSQGAAAITELLLFFAGREDHLIHRVLPTLMNAHHIITDRFASSSYAFQIYGDEHHDLLPVFELLMERIVNPGNYSPRSPDAYIFLDLEPAEALRRCRADAEKTSKFDVRPIGFHLRVREGYRRFAQAYGAHSEMVFIDANRSIEAVHDELLETINTIFDADDDNREL